MPGGKSFPGRIFFGLLSWLAGRIDDPVFGGAVNSICMCVA